MSLGLCGCALVSTHVGSAKEYLDDHAAYCDPDDVASIRAAVERAYRDGPRKATADMIRAKYTWGAAAEATVRAYERALG